jgi:hypothetical protein
VELSGSNPAAPLPAVPDRFAASKALFLKKLELCDSLKGLEFLNGEVLLGDK